MLSYPPVVEPREAFVKFKVTDAEKERLQRLAAERGRSLSEICRVAVLREEGRRNNAMAATSQ